MMLQQIIAQAAVTLDQWEQISKLWEQQNQLFKAFKRQWLLKRQVQNRIRL